MLVLLLLSLSISQGLPDPEECSRFCPQELRATVFDTLMVRKITFIRKTLEAAIDGLEELEQKTADVPDSMKEKLGINSEDGDDDTTEEMKSFLMEQLDSILISDLRAWDMVTDTYQDIMEPSRAPAAPKNLTDLRSDLAHLVASIQWSSDSLQPLLSTLGRRLARIFNSLIRMMETMMKFGGEEVMIEKMKERDIDNFMGRVLIEILRLKKEDSAEEFNLNVFNDLSNLAQVLDQDFYQKARKLSSEDFWKSEIEYFQTRLSGMEFQDDEVRYVAELIRIYLK